MADITKVANPPDGWTYEAYLPPADEWMIDNYDENKLTLSTEQAKDFEERATQAGLTIVLFPQRC
jgi:hypothetical protein